MAHHICCPRRRDRDVASPDPPSRPYVEMDGALDSAFTMCILPEDHPHGRRFHLSPVDFGILKSPKIADKIKLKMGRKSSRTLRNQLSQIMDGPYNPDAHAITSTSIVDATGTPSPYDEAGKEARNDQDQSQSLPSRIPKRFGTASGSDEATHLFGNPRPALYSPSIYSRSQSRVDGEKPRPGGKAGSAMNRLMRPNSDFFGLAYRMILPRKPSVSTTAGGGGGGNGHSRHDSRHLSASTDSTITRRLEESGGIDSSTAYEGFDTTLYDPAFYGESQEEIRVDTVTGNLGTIGKKDEEQEEVKEHKRQVSEHRERV